ncbi:MAG: 1,4-dihydroxy-2-naphthoate polyprenyltransferase [Actinobacteria bacterium]|nr:1,4-dihydroxy-2-naphthoate polyprenyltransferase [Actinomycetota bacterium]
MTRPTEWLQGARPRTLGAAVSPVVVGTAVAYAEVAHVGWERAVLALVVALGLQVGVNYANDYSDGVRGTDRDRRGPLRLTASGLATPEAVRRASALAIAISALAGLALAMIVTPWLLLVGSLAIAAAVFYTGGPKPYGYHGLGELMVLVFFGFVATAGSTFVQLERIPEPAWWASLTVGLLACAILVANNLRDVETDRAAGKRTLAARLGVDHTRSLYLGCVAVAFGAVFPVAVDHHGAFAALLALPLAIEPARLVITATTPLVLVRALVTTARLQLATALLLGVGLWLS